MNLKKKLALGGIVVTLLTPITPYATMNGSVQSELIRNFKNYNTSLHLDVKGTSKSDFDNHIKNIRQYNVDSVRIGGVTEGKVNLYITYYETKKQMEEVNRIASLVAIEVQGLTDKEKVYHIVQRTGELLRYENKVDDTIIFSPYAVIEGGEGVCQAYARFADLVFKKANIESKFIEGTVKDSLHIWNSVKIDGEWFGVDATSADEDNQNKIDFDFVLMGSQKQKELGMKVTYSSVRISDRDIQDFTGIGLISTKNKTFWSNKGNQIYGIDYQGDLNIELVTTEAEDFWVLGGNLITLKDGTLQTEEEVLAKYVEKDKVKIKGSNLMVNGTTVYSPITLPAGRVKAIYGDSKVIIKDGDKNYFIEYLDKRTNVYYKNDFLIQMLRY